MTTFASKRLGSKLLIVDSAPLIIKATQSHLWKLKNEHGNPKYNNLSQDKTPGLNYFLRTLLDKILYLQPTHLCIAFDEADHNARRREIFADYKKHRPKHDDSVYEQLKLLPKVCEILNIKCVTYPKHESDDVIYSYANLHNRLYNTHNNDNNNTNTTNDDSNQMKEKGIGNDLSYETHILGNDKDLLVLLNDPNVIIHRLMRQDKTNCFEIKNKYKERIIPVSIDTFIINKEYSDAEQVVKPIDFEISKNNSIISATTTKNKTNQKNEENNNNNNNNKNWKSENERKRTLTRGSKIKPPKWFSRNSMVDNYQFSYKIPPYYSFISSCNNNKLSVPYRFDKPQFGETTKWDARKYTNLDDNSIDIEWSYTQRYISDTNPYNNHNDNDNALDDDSSYDTPHFETKELWIRCGSDAHSNNNNNNNKNDSRERIPLKKYHIRKSQCGIFLALVGDAVDGIKGCPKIGNIRAMTLLDEYPQIVDFKSLLQCIPDLDKNDKIPSIVVKQLNDKNNLKIIETAWKLVELQDVSKKLPTMNQLKIDYSKLWRNETIARLIQLDVKLDGEFVHTVNKYLLKH